jgi:hypothetical protein
VFLIVDRRRAANVNESVLCSAPGSEKLKPNGLVDGRERAFKGGGFTVIFCAVDKLVGGSCCTMAGQRGGYGSSGRQRRQMT